MRFIVSYSLLFVKCVFICAQTINNGLYINEERDEFVIIKNDSIQFRYLNGGGLISYTIGEGILKKKRGGKYIINPSPSLIEKTSVMYRHQRNDDGLSIKFFNRDGLPIPGMNIKISLIGDRKPYVMNFADIHGQFYLNEMQIDYFDKKEVLIHATFIGQTDTEKRASLERGYDYIIISRMPEKYPCFIAKGNYYEFFQLNEYEIGRYIDGKIIVKLKKIADEYPLSDFPFDKDLAVQLPP